VQVEPEVRLHAVAHRLQDATLRGLEPPSVPVHVDALGVASLKALRAVRVEHRYHVDRCTVGDALCERVIGSLVEEPDDIGESHGGGALVTVHLGPQEDLRGAAAEREMTDLPAFRARSRDPMRNRPAQMSLHRPPVRLVIEAPIIEFGHAHAVV
jgi:hypothetical protein